MDERKREEEDERSVLRGHIAEADAMLGMLSSEAGKKFFALMKSDYAAYVAAAVRESEKYREACRHIEHVFALVGDTLNAGKEAQAGLDRLASGEADEGY